MNNTGWSRKSGFGVVAMLAFGLLLTMTAAGSIALFGQNTLETRADPDPYKETCDASLTSVGGSMMTVQSSTSLSSINSWLAGLATGSTNLLTFASDYTLTGQIVISGGYNLIIQGSTSNEIVSRDSGITGDLFWINHDSVEVTFSNIIIDGQKSSVSQVVGALVRQEKGTLNINKCAELRNNNAADMASGGGAIRANSGAVNINGGYIHHNDTVRAGGGVSGGPSSAININGGAIVYNTAKTIASSVDATRCDLDGNGGVCGGGGGVQSGGYINMSGGVVANNSVTTDYVSGADRSLGGGIFSGEGGFIMTGGEIRDNQAEGSGGGLFVMGVFDISGGTITNNQATAPTSGSSHGGGLHIIVSDDGGELSDTVVITNNSATYGGGVYISGGAAVFSGGQISNNSATYGAGVFSSNWLTLSGGTISNNSASSHGGGVYASASILYVDGVTIGGGTGQANTAQNGAGVYGTSGSTVYVRSGEVSYNTASLRGGGIGSLGNVTVLSGEISNNSVSGDGYGGGIYIGGTLTASGGEIFNNSASNSGGGICSVTSAGTITIDGSYIHNNSATSYGGGIYSAGEINLNNGMIGGNSPSQANSSNYGGGIYAAGVLNMTNGKVAYNTAERGGGIYVNNDDTVNISGGEVSNNAANGLGGGILGGTGSTTNLTGGVVSNNTAASRGGGIYIFGALNMSGGILSGNNATGGAGVYFSTSSAINLSGSPQIGVSQSDNGIAFVAGKVLKVIGDLGSSSRINIETIPSAAAGVVVANKVDSSSTAVNAIDSDAAKFYYAPGVALDPVIKVMPSGTNYVLNTLYLNINLSSNIVQIAGSSGLSPTAAGVFVSGSNILTTNTNNPAGYSVSISTNLPSSDPHASDMSHQSIADTYLPVSANVCSWDDTAKTLINTNNTLSANTYGFTIDSISLSSQKLCRIPDQNSPLTIKSTTTSSLTGDTTTFYYGTKIDLGQVAGEYRASIVYTVVPNP